MKRLTAALTTAGLALAGLTLPIATATATPSAPTAPSVAAVTWGPCDNATLASYGAQCGFVTVPLDYAKPGGTTIELAVSRLKHTVPDAQYQGIMMVNPGGPGGSGLIYAVLQGAIPKNAGAAYDWIGFDPRGVGSSIPALSCDADYLAGPKPNYIPVNPDSTATWRAKARGYSQACGEAGGALLAHMKTTDNVADIDSIRAALGRQQINFYGFSYGTYLAQVYGTTYPNKVRRMVMDGNVDPRDVWYQANLNQNVAFEKPIQQFFAWIATYDSTYHLGKTKLAVEARFYLTQDSLKTKPIAGVVGDAEWNDIFLSAGYAQFLWPELASVFSAYVVSGDTAPVLAEYAGGDGSGDDNGYAVYLATQCTDAPWPKDFAVWRDDAWRTFVQGPYVSWGNTWFNVPCISWPAKSATPVKVDGSKVPGVLLISETLDGATPFKGSLEVRKRFPKSSLIAVVGGTTHANSLAGNPCVDDPIADYLATGALPKRVDGAGPDVRCAPLPKPVPDETLVSAEAGAAVDGSLRPALQRALRR